MTQARIPFVISRKSHSPTTPPGVLATEIIVSTIAIIVAGATMIAMAQTVEKMALDKT